MANISTRATQPQRSFAVTLIDSGGNSPTTPTPVRRNGWPSNGWSTELRGQRTRVPLQIDGTYAERREEWELRLVECRSGPRRGPRSNISAQHLAMEVALNLIPLTLVLPGADPGP